MSAAPLIQFLAGLCTANGLRPAGHGVYVVELDGNFGLIDWTRRSGDGLTSIQPYLAIASRRIAHGLGREPEVTHPEIFRHPWYRWAFAIHDESPDWGLLSLTAPTTWSEAGRDMETRILPALKEHTPDEGLIACWMRYPDPFLPPVERLAYLALLAQELGPASTHEFATAELAAVLADGGPQLRGLQQVAPIIRQLGMLLPG